MPETHKMGPVGGLFSGAWRMYKERFAVLLKIALIPALFLGLGNIAISQGFPVAILGGLFDIAGWVLTIFATIAITISLAHNTDFNESYRRSTSLFWPYIWVAILTAVVTFGGFIMLIVPGIIFGVSLAFSKFVIILENRRGLDALAQSRAYTKGYWWAILGRSFLLGLCFMALLLLIYLPAVFVLGQTLGVLIYALLLLFVTPFSVVFIYEMYKNLVALKPEVHSNHAPATGKTFLTVSAIVGLVAPIVIAVLAIVLLAVFVRSSSWDYKGMPYYDQYPAVSTSTGPALGRHCGGFIQNAPTCPSGYHCKLDTNIPDAGGICLPD